MTTFHMKPIDPAVHASLLDGAGTFHDNAVRTVRADAHPGYPCRLSLEDATPGEEVFLLSHAPFAGRDPYHETGPIFVRKNAVPAALRPGEVPPIALARPVVVRGYDRDERMVRAEMTDGEAVSEAVRRCLADPSVAFAHLRAALTGCFLCRADRVEGDVSGLAEVAS